jgi:dipeptidase D
MSTPIRDLQPTLLFRHFENLIAIPRGSGNEEAARQYVLSFAREHAFDSRVDAVKNVVVVVPATPGHESAPTIVLQGHLDIVCEKHSHVAHDFNADGIPAFVDGDHIRTRGTTLGADNGIGVAAGLAIAEDPEAVHGPLEILCTIDEETGMTGAFGLRSDLLKGRTMLNLDSEDEGTLFIGCAGGGDVVVRIPVTRVVAPAGAVGFKVTVAGLKGGHSGLDIGRNRGNAIRILARALEAGAGFHAVGLACLEGGSKRNAIPREASACVWVPADLAPAFAAKVESLAARVRVELGKADPELAIAVGPIPCDCKPVAQSGAILRLLLALPHGPIVMSQDIVGLVETSTNVGIVALDDATCTVTNLSRSSVGPAMDAVRESIRAAGELAGGTAELCNSYPGWRPDVDSPVLKVCRDVWKQATGKDALVTAIHAGLECGVIGENVPGMDMVSFGPDIRGAHSPDENVSVGSTARFYDYLKAVLARLA